MDYYVVTMTEIYGHFESEQDAINYIAELEESDRKARDFYLKKYGYIPSDVDIPNGYYITQNPYF